MGQNIETILPPIESEGFNTAKPATFDNTVTFNGAVSFASTPTALRRPVESVNGDQTLLSTESGKMFVDVKGSGTTTFTLPSAAAGYYYTFVCGNASGEILINPATGDAIVCKSDAGGTGTGVAPAAGTGIKNTAATNVVGDSITLVALDTTTWYAVAQLGVWASQ